jgi:hypothetical protein
MGMVIWPRAHPVSVGNVNNRIDCCELKWFLQDIATPSGHCMVEESSLRSSSRLSSGTKDLRKRVLVPLALQRRRFMR